MLRWQTKQNVADVEDRDIVVGMLQSVAVMHEYEPDVFDGFGLGDIRPSSRHPGAGVLPSTVQMLCSLYVGPISDAGAQGWNVLRDTLVRGTHVHGATS